MHDEGVAVPSLPGITQEGPKRFRYRRSVHGGPRRYRPVLSISVQEPEVQHRSHLLAAVRRLQDQFARIAAEFMFTHDFLHRGPVGDHLYPECWRGLPYGDFSASLSIRQAEKSDPADSKLEQRRFSGTILTGREEGGPLTHHRGQTS